MGKKVSEDAETKVEEVVSESKKPKKGKKIALKVSIITAIVALLAVGGFFAYKFFMSKDPVKVTSKAIRGLKDGISGVKEENSELTKLLESGDAFEIKSEIKLDLPKEIGNDYVIKLLAQADQENEEVKFDLSAKEGYTTIADLSALIDASKVYFKLNDTMSNYYFTKLEESFDQIDLEELPTIPDYDFENIIDYLADAVDGTLSSKDFTKDKDELTIGDNDVKVTRYTAELDEVKLKAIVDKFLDKVLKDKKLIGVLAEMSGEDEGDIKDAIKEFKSMKADELGEISFDYSVYVTSMGDAIAWGFGAEGTDVVIAYYKDVLSFQVLYQGMRGALEFEKKSDDHYVATLDLMGMVTGELDIKTSLDTVKKNEEYKYTLDANLKVNVYGQDPVKGSLNAETTIKKIDKVDTSAKIGAKAIEDLNSIEASQFERELTSSKTYKFMSGLIGELDSSVIDY